MIHRIVKRNQVRIAPSAEEKKLILANAHNEFKIVVATDWDALSNGYKKVISSLNVQTDKTHRALKERDEEREKKNKAFNALEKSKEIINAQSLAKNDIDKRLNTFKDKSQKAYNSACEKIAVLITKNGRATLEIEKLKNRCNTLTIFCLGGWACFVALAIVYYFCG